MGLTRLAAAAPGGLARVFADVADAVDGDGADVDGVPVGAVVRPATVAEASAVVRRAHEQGLAVVPRGAGTAVGLGAPPRAAHVVLDLSRLDRVLEHRPEDLVVTAQAGIRLAALGDALRPHRQRVDVGTWDGGVRSLGGVLATGESGPLPPGGLGPRDHVLGVRFLQADGTPTWGGARVVKSVAGYDVPKLLVGSLGTLGVIVEATVRAMPLPAHERIVEATASEEAAEAVRAAVLDSALAPRAVVLSTAPSPRAWRVTVRFEGPRRSVDDQAAAFASTARRLGLRTGDASAADAAWTAVAAAPMRLRLAARSDRVLAWTTRARSELATLGAGAALVDGAAGVARVALAPAPPQMALVRSALERIRAPLAAEGGHLVVERSPARLKQGLDVWGPVPRRQLDVMRRLKHALDPRGTLNPGRFVGGI